MSEQKMPIPISNSNRNSKNPNSIAISIGYWEGAEPKIEGRGTFCVKVFSVYYFVALNDIQGGDSMQGLRN